MAVQYDRGAEPVTVQIFLDQGGFDVVEQFAYEFAGAVQGRLKLMRSCNGTCSR